MKSLHTECVSMRTDLFNEGPGSSHAAAVSAAPGLPAWPLNSPPSTAPLHNHIIWFICQLKEVFCALLRTVHRMLEIECHQCVARQYLSHPNQFSVETWIVCFGLSISLSLIPSLCHKHTHTHSKNCVYLYSRACDGEGLLSTLFQCVYFPGSPLFC